MSRISFVKSLPSFFSLSSAALFEVAKRGGGASGVESRINGRSFIPKSWATAAEWDSLFVSQANDGEHLSSSLSIQVSH